jgi:hypothetical protein
MLWITPEAKAALAKGRAPIHGVNPVVGFKPGDRAEESRYEMARMDPRATDSPIFRHLLERAPVHNPHCHLTSFMAFYFINYRLRRQLVAFQKRFRLLELPQPEIRPEFDHHTSNAGMLQSRTSHLEEFPEFHWLSTRRPRVLWRQSGGLKLKTPGPMPSKLIAVDIFSSRF